MGKRVLILLCIVFISGVFANTVITDNKISTLGPVDASKFMVDGESILFVPNQSNFVGTLYLGNEGLLLNDSGVDAGDFNTYVGIGVASNSSLAKKNTGLGWNALNKVQEGWANTAVGYMALSSGVGNFTISGNGGEFYANTALGESSLRNNLGGSYNTALGTSSMIYNTEGNNNVAVGVHALNNNIGGNYSIGIGRGALYYNTYGVSNIGIGSNALHQSELGSDNIAIGRNDSGCLWRK